VPSSLFAIAPTQKREYSCNSTVFPWSTGNHGSSWRHWIFEFEGSQGAHLAARARFDCRSSPAIHIVSMEKKEIRPVTGAG
jgi:hypothetical protein